MRLELNSNQGNLGFQIAPMIDVVFVIMLFMFMAGAVKAENELNTQLPGTAETSNSTDFVDEQIIPISDSGEVSLNDEPFDSATSKELPQLKGTLMRLKENAKAAKTPLSSRSSATRRRNTAGRSTCSTRSRSRRSTTSPSR